MKRSGRFYRRNEAEVMEMLGLMPTPGSGSGWVVKEDGQSDDVICQLKSTDASSIRIHKQDIDKLLYNASVSKKVPVFAIQFLQSHETYLLVRPDDLQQVADYIETGEVQTAEDFLGIDTTVADTSRVCVECSSGNSNSAIKSSSAAREAFARARMEKFAKERKSAL